MRSIPVSVGLDHHQDSVQGCVVGRAGDVLRNGSIENDALVIATVVENYGTEVHAAIESYTGTADLADLLALRGGWTIKRAHPEYVARLKQNPDKTDSTDARTLADLERAGNWPKAWLAPQEVRALRSPHPMQVSTATGAAKVHLGLRALGLAALPNKYLRLTTRSTCRVIKALCRLRIVPAKPSRTPRIRAARELPRGRLCG